MSEVTEETKLTISDFKSQISCMINAITQLNSTDRTEAFGYLLKCVNNLDTEKEIKNDNEEVKENKEIDQEKCESNLEYSGHETLNDCIEDQGENDQQHQEVNSTLNEYIDTNSSKYKCAACDETFLKLKQLYFHGVKQHPGSSMTCENCNKSFSNEQINDIHTYLKICKSHEPLICSFCNKEYRNFQHFSLHLEGHKQNNCKECGLNLSNRKSLEEHTIKEHNKKLDRQLFMCKFCDRKFAQKRSLLKHYKLQHSKDNIICLACGAVFKSTEELKEHEQTHVEKNVSFTCVICKENFSRRQQYVIHMKDHDKYQCETCELSYPNKTKLEWHEQKGHVIKGLPMQHQCSICSNEFHFQSSLFFHKKLHSNSEKDKFECKPCKQIFKTYEICRQHLLTERHAKFTNQTESDEILMCKYCKKVFTNKRLLLKHENKHNKGNVIYQCEICDFKTRSNPCLNKHEKLHTKKKELICDKCGDSFYTKSALLDHFSYVHSDERNFSCEKCGRTFKTASVLNRHMLSHSNESTFRCISCGKSFKFRGNLTRHLMLVHSETTASKRVKRLISDDVANLTSNSSKKKKKQELKQQQQQHDNTATLYAVIDAQSVSIPIDQVIMQSSVLLSNSHQDNQMLHLSLNNMNFSNETKSQLIYTQPLDITNLQEVDNILQSEESLKNTTEMVNSVHDNMFEQQLTDADANNAFLNTESLIHPPIEPSLVTSLGDSLNSGTHQLDDPHHHQLAGTSQSNLLPISEYNTLPVPYNIQFLNM